MSKTENETSQLSAVAIPEVDYGRAAQDYARWRQGFPAEFFSRLEGLHIGRPDQNILDLGTGTGLLAREFAQQGCSVTGLDLSQKLLDEAKRLDKAAGVATEYHLAAAEDTGLKSASFDVVCAATCWHWLDRPKVAREGFRLLKRDGRLLIAHLDWLNLPGNVIDITLQTIRQFNPAPLTKPITFQYPDWLVELIEAGFDSWEIFGFNTVQDYTQEAWRGRIRASRLVGPDMAPETLKKFDETFARALATHFPADVLAVDHRIFAIILWRR